MTDRYTFKDTEYAFRRLCAAFGKREATAYNDAGAWDLEHIRQYGGANIMEILDDKGRQRAVFGYRKRNNREFVEWANAIHDGLALFDTTETYYLRMRAFNNAEYIAASKEKHAS